LMERPMCTDTELLRQYACEHLEGAFTELVRRHVNLVYSAALREAAGDTAQAEDLAQAVFAELARKASQLLDHPALAGWLYASVRHVAANHRRADMRRRQREQSASIMNDTPSSGTPETPEAVWSQIRPLLDDAMHELGETDRAAVVQRFFQEQSLKEIGHSLGLTENAARMRVDRALDKLRELLARRGIHSTASGLAAALAVGAVFPAPSTLAASIVATTLAGVAVVSSNSLTLAQIIAMTKLKIGIVSALIVAGVATPVWQQTRVNRLAHENARLAEQSAQMEPLQKEVERLRQSGAASAELAESRGEVSRLRSELAKLRGNAGEVSRKKTENARLLTELAKKDSENGTNELTGAMSDLMKNLSEQQVQGRLSRMKEKLNLAPDQAKAIEEILLAQATRR
jgi:RNA polymerase sigma factor (sigma-70 family)